MAKRVCPCGVEFEVSKFFPKQVYHSKSCQKKAYMNVYNKEGARRRSALEKEVCPTCGAFSRNWARVEVWGKVCANCAEKIKNGQAIGSDLFSSNGGVYHGRNWWIGRIIGKFKVVDIPIDPLCDGPWVETLITLECPLGHHFKKPASRVGSVCPECLKLAKAHKVKFKSFVLPDKAGFDEWGQILKEQANLELLEAPENAWYASKRMKVVCRCWCGKIFEPQWSDIVRKRTVSCGCISKSSQANEEIFQFVKGLGVDAIAEHPIEQLSIDVYVPSVGLAIEHNGHRWHRGDQDYKKYNLFKRNGITYFGIYEDEWLRKKPLIKSMISDKVGKHTKTLDVQRLAFSHVVINDDYADFMKLHNLGGIVEYGCDPMDSIRHTTVAVYDCKEIVAAMLFEQTSMPTSDYWVKMACHNRSYNIPGLWKAIQSWASRHVGIHTAHVITDNRLGDDSRWIEMGYKIEQEIEPDFYWVNGLRRMPSSYEPADPEKWHKLYDCGKKLWRYKYAMDNEDCGGEGSGEDPEPVGQ